MNPEFDPRVDNPAFSRAPHGEPWRAWLSLPGAFLSGRNKDEQLRLWLLLADGRVLVFRLLGLTPDDALATALALALADDVAGDVQEPNLDVAGWAGVLYGAPASPVHCAAPESAAFGKALAFHGCLDGKLVALLAELAGKNSFWASARNYSRLTRHARRNERIQALQRYPLLVAPVLLTHQRWPNLDDIKRFRWRAHNDAVVAAIDAGRDLTGALARHYGVSRGLVRSPYCAQAWPGSSGRTLVDLLKFLDAIPAHRRPASGAELDRYSHHLPALWSLFGDNVQSAAEAFHDGFGVAWARLLRRFDSPDMPLNSVMIDARDYLRALATWLNANHRHRRTEGEIAARWVRQRGLASLLAASMRWHARLPPVPPGRREHLPESLPAVVGAWSDGEWTATELIHWKDICEEGATMHHCIADYWADCVLAGHRVFTLTCHIPLATESTEACRATALYELEESGDQANYVFSDVRGLANALVDTPMQAFALRLATILNAPTLLAARQAARRFAQTKDWGKDREVAMAARVDPDSVAALTALFDLPQAPPGHAANHLYAPVAGYGYAFDASRETAFAKGQPLTLTREADNPADPLAIRIGWAGHKIGYVPRPDNAHFALQMDAGQLFTACIGDFVPQAPMWKRLWLRIEPL